MKKLLGVIAVAALLPATAHAGLGGLTDKMKGAKDAATCNDDKGVEQAGKDMDEKAYNALISVEGALAGTGEAASKADVAKGARENLTKWGNKDKAPTGGDRIKEIKTASGSIQKLADEAAKAKLDDKAKKALGDARNELRKAVIYAAWASKIAEPVPANAKAAIEGSKACSAKVKGPADAAAGLGALLTDIKGTYTKVSDAAKKAGAPEQTAAEKAAQDSAVGAPAGVAGV